MQDCHLITLDSQRARHATAPLRRTTRLNPGLAVAVCGVLASLGFGLIFADAITIMIGGR